MASFIQRREENLKIAQSSQDYNTGPCFQKNKFILKITTPNDISQLSLLSSLHYPTDPSGFSLRLLALPSPYRPSSLLHLSKVFTVSSHTLSFASHFQFDPSQGPTDLTPPSHISHFSTAGCQCLLFPWMAQAGLQAQNSAVREALSTSQCSPFTCTPQTRPFPFSPAHRECQ